MLTQRNLMQWYKPDGTPLPRPGPTDAYHMTLYRRRGLALVPPDSNARTLEEAPTVPETPPEITVGPVTIQPTALGNVIEV